MMADLLVLTLTWAQLSAAAAVLFVLALRPAARRLLGPELAYRLWMLVPIAATTSLFPTLREFLTRYGNPHIPVLAPGFSGVVLAVFAAGVLATVLLFAHGERRFRRLASQRRAGPAVVGLSWPRIVVPADYEARFTAAERRLILEHERAHIARRDPRDNLVIAAVQALGWCNPLVHLAVRFVRLDQELACDAAVVARMPDSRGLYARTLLKAHGGAPPSVFACALADGGLHPLEVRLRNLKRARPTVDQYVKGVMLVGGLAILTAVSVWSLSPKTMSSSEPLPIVSPSG